MKLTKEEVRTELLKELSRPDWRANVLTQILSDLDFRITIYNKTPAQIHSAVYWAAGVNTELIMSKSRKDEVVIARDILFKYYRNKKLPLKVIGKKFNKDHATVLNGLKRLQNDIDTNYHTTMDIIYRINEYFENEQR